MTPLTHAPTGDDPFARYALCSTTLEPDRVLLLTQVLGDIDCNVCLALLATRRLAGGSA